MLARLALGLACALRLRCRGGGGARAGRGLRTQKDELGISFSDFFLRILFLRIWGPFPPVVCLRLLLIRPLGAAMASLSVIRWRSERKIKPAERPRRLEAWTGRDVLVPALVAAATAMLVNMCSHWYELRGLGLDDTRNVWRSWYENRRQNRRTRGRAGGAPCRRTSPWL